jgi:hypothetical protein
LAGQPFGKIARSGNDVVQRLGLGGNDLWCPAGADFRKFGIDTERIADFGENTPDYEISP